VNTPGIFSDRWFRLAAILTLVAGLVYVATNLFIWGGDEFVYGLNSFLVSPLAIITSIMASRVWLKMKAGMQSRLLWGGLLAGWVCWAVAESLWAMYSLLGQDPYPSWADFFFLLGYIPMSIGFLSRLRGLPKKPEMGQQVVIWTISLIVVYLTSNFVLAPIIQEYDIERFLESALGLFYPLADLLLLLLVLNTFYTYGSGDYGLGWRFILVGFTIVTISDLFFSYADWNGMYYPDGTANFISRFAVDVPYNFSYVLWSLGSYLLGILLHGHQPLKIDVVPRSVPNAHIFIFIQKDGTVIDVSQNYFRLLPPDDPRGAPLGRVLNLPVEQDVVIHEKLRSGKILTDFPLWVANRVGEVQEVWLCGVAIINQPIEYTGAVLVLRAFLPGDDADDGLSEYQRSILPYILEKSNSAEKTDIIRLLFEYHMAYIKSLFNLVFREGGAAMSQSLLDELRLVARRRGWEIVINSQTIVDGRLAQPDVLKEALPVFLETSRQFAIHLTDPVTVETEMAGIHAQMEDTIHKTVARLVKN
jgi:hypothetical protein